MTISQSLPPSGSAIIIEPGAEGLVLTLPKPPQSWTRFGSAAFLSFWLCGWLVGEVFAAMALFGSAFGEGDKGMPLFGKLFLLAWLGGWTVGGVFAIMSLVGLLRPAKLGRLALSPDELIYNAPSGSLDPSKMRNRGFAGIREMTRRPKPVAILRAEASEPRLERVGDALRLTIDHGIERVDIGDALSEPEKEWLADLLHRWKEA